MNCHKTIVTHNNPACGVGIIYKKFYVRSTITRVSVVRMSTNNGYQALFRLSVQLENKRPGNEAIQCKTYQPPNL